MLNGTDLAARIAPKDREPTAAEAWQTRCLLAQEALSPEDASKTVTLVHEVLRVRENVRAQLVIIPGRGWQPNPHRGDVAYAARRSREIWRQYGELLGVGEPPWPDKAFEVDLDGQSV